MERNAANFGHPEVRKIFIDTNIYLGFYNSNKPEFKKLLSSLVELSGKIIITSQIIDEINRNKLSVFINSIENYTKQVGFVRTFLPEHLDDDHNPKLSKWNKKRKKIEADLEDLNEELKDISTNTLKEISQSNDKVSRNLEVVFKNPLKTSKKIYDDAQKRKQVGTPPGKFNDPVGDQINWLQILGNSKNITKLWIVSTDQDFFNSYGDSIFLNPLLYKELKEINPEIEVSVYTKLSEALSDFNRKEVIKSLPSSSQLEKISNEEPYQIMAKNIYYGGGFAMPLKCPVCDAENSFSHGSYLKSKYGGHTYQYVCSICGYRYDTGSKGDSFKK
ncbi:MAG: DUF4935 domain-containing protein [Chitinophagales bacterium]|nr:DUF4935 domain-containing protein [Chitinophagales bacterium]